MPAKIIKDLDFFLRLAEFWAFVRVYFDARELFTRTICLEASGTSEFFDIW
jgi:hypothetical protein